MDIKNVPLAIQYFEQLNNAQGVADECMIKMTDLLTQYNEVKQTRLDNLAIVRDMTAKLKALK